jgi:dTDP-4-dehydrorhamnose reductase
MHTMIIGSQGQLGREITSRLDPHETFAATRANIDLADTASIHQGISQHQPKLVINCAAYNKVDDAEKDSAPAFAVNAFGVRELARACESVGATLVHFSTDYVFGSVGFRPNPYRESDAPGPLSSYGTSKLTGEYFVRAYCSRHFVIRTCGLYGKHGVGGKGGNFVETMMKLATAGKTIRVVNDQILTPSSASDVAAASLKLMEDCPFGLYHLTNAGQCSWYDFAAAIFELKKLNADLQPTTTREYNSPALRPPYSVLTSEHRNAPKLKPWREALADYLSPLPSGEKGRG